MEFQALSEASDQVCDFLKTCSGRHRLKLLLQLLEGEGSVGDLAEAVAGSTTATSQQLAILRHAGFVTTRRDGQRIFYSLSSPKAARFIQSMLDVLGAQEAEARDLR